MSTKNGERRIDNLWATNGQMKGRFAILLRVDRDEEEGLGQLTMENGELITSGMQTVR